MNLTDTGESRVNGYLFVLERSLEDVPAGATSCATPCARSSRTCASASPPPTARRTSATALERILAELGPPLRVAQAYSAERTIDEAVATGRFVPIAARHLAARAHHRHRLLRGARPVRRLRSSAIALLRDRRAEADLPEQRRLAVRPTAFPSASARISRCRRTATVGGGYWIIPVALVLRHGASSSPTQRGARRYLAWWRNRRRLVG